MSCIQHASNRTVPWVYSSVSASHFRFTGHHFPTAFPQETSIWTEFFLWNKACKYLIAWLSLAWSKRADYFSRCSGMPAPLHTFLSPQTFWVLRAFTFDLQLISNSLVAMTFSIFWLSSICGILTWNSLSEQWEAEPAVCFQLQPTVIVELDQKRQMCGWMHIPQCSVTQ